MKIRTLLSLCVFLVFMSYFTSCDSSSYEIEEVEVNDEDTSKYAQNTDIKQEIESPQNEIKDDASKSPPVKYTIQIGAFQFESNAIGYLKRARETFNYTFEYKKINGLYKIRIITIFNTQDDAMPILTKIKEAGFDDSFITEVGK